MTGREYMLSKIDDDQLVQILFAADLKCSDECPIKAYCDRRHKEIMDRLKKEYPDVDPDPEEAEDIYFDNAYNELGCYKVLKEFIGIEKEAQNAGN